MKNKLINLTLALGLGLGSNYLNPPQLPKTIQHQNSSLVDILTHLSQQERFTYLNQSKVSSLNLEEWMTLRLQEDIEEELHIYTDGENYLALSPQNKNKDLVRLSQKLYSPDQLTTEEYFQLGKYVSLLSVDDLVKRHIANLLQLSQSNILGSNETEQLSLLLQKGYRQTSIVLKSQPQITYQNKNYSYLASLHNHNNGSAASIVDLDKSLAKPILIASYLDSKQKIGLRLIEHGELVQFRLIDFNFTGYPAEYLTYKPPFIFSEKGLHSATYFNDQTYSTVYLRGVKQFNYQSLAPSWSSGVLVVDYLGDSALLVK